jgi:opacity protein-like surface antigen
MNKLCCSIAVFLATSIFASSIAFAQAERFEIGVRGSIAVANGEPANDIPGHGIFARYYLNERWAIGVALERSEYDFEKPAAVLGLRQDPGVDAIDALAKASTVSAWLQRNYQHAGSPYRWFWSVGLGSASVDVPNAAGPLDGGGTFDIKTSAKREFILSAGAGLQRSFGKSWFAELGVRADQHFADWKLTDRVSGRTGSIDDYLAIGVHVGLGYRF